MPLVPKLIIDPTDKVVVCGDSLTEQGWWFGLAGRGTRAIDIGRTPGRGGYYRNSGQPAGLTWINSGHSGDRSSNIAADVPGRITAHGAQCLILAVGVNDAYFGVSDGTFSTNYNSIADQARAAQPGLKIACATIFTIGDDVPNGTEANIDAKNAIMAATAARVSGTYMDVRSKVVQYLLANNPGHAPAGILTDDGIHASDTVGKPMYSAWAAPYVQYTGR